MCPGGTVCAAASAEGGVVTNGNGACTPATAKCQRSGGRQRGWPDFDNDPAKAVAFQRRLEQAAYRAGRGIPAPAETVGSFWPGAVRWNWARCSRPPARRDAPNDLGSLLPGELSGALRDGLTAFWPQAGCLPCP